MGREWLYWIGGGGRSTARGGRKSGELEEAGTSAGCMRAVLQLFDLNHHHQQQQPPSDFHHDSPSLHGESIRSRGVEAPRNSLELSQSMEEEEEEHSTFPLGIQIKTRFHEFSSETSCNSPGTRTPNLVARLMGLDSLSECTSPSLSSSSNSKPQIRRMTGRNCYYDDDDIHVRSLPETPRMSAARRSDVESHRLSLQINKENRNQEFAALPEKKQVREKMGRRVGLDITNIKRSREVGRRDENLIILKPRKKKDSEEISVHVESTVHLKPIKRITESCSGGMRPDGEGALLRKPQKKHYKIQSQGISKPVDKVSAICSEEISLDNRKNTTRMTATTNASRRVSRISSSSANHSQYKGTANPLMRKQEHEQYKNGQRDGTTTGKCNSSSSLNKSNHRTYHDRPIRNNKDETFSRSMTSRGMKQSQVSDALSSERRTQLSSRTSHSYRHLHLQQHPNTDKIPTAVPDRDNGCATPPTADAAAAYREYIHKILEHGGLLNNLIPSTLRLPIEPSIFLRLEKLHPTTTDPGGAGISTVLSHRCNRKLIFQLIDELLSEIPTTHFDSKPWVSLDVCLPLLEEMCKKIDRFPAAKCQTLEDIDSLINMDVHDTQLDQSLSEKEKCGIVCDIESEIVDLLVTETAAVIDGVTEDEQTLFH